MKNHNHGPELSTLFIDRLWKANPTIHFEYVFLQICADSYFILDFLLFTIQVKIARVLFTVFFFLSSVSIKQFPVLKQICCMENINKIFKIDLLKHNAINVI